jgi:ribose transport system ATP-binding protein
VDAEAFLDLSAAAAVAEGEAPLLAMAGIGKTFGGVTALAGVDFDLRRGEVHGLVGENGAGKSTLMKIIAGLHHDYDGEMRLDGRPVRFRSARDALAAGIGMVHQELSIVPSLSVAENVFLGVQPTNAMGVVGWRRMAREAEEHLRRLGIELDPGLEAGRLPLGLQQLVELGRVLFSGARIIILDEPTSALSPPEVERLFGVLRRLKAAGTTFVFISHFLEDVLAISDRITVFRNGRRIATEGAAGIDKAWLIQAMIGRGHAELEEALTGAVRLQTPEAAPVVLEVERLELPGAFTEVSFRLRAGEVLGLYGFMGSGQMELAKALMGKLVPRRGAIRIDGKPVRLTSTSRAKRAGIALVPESRRSMLFAQVPVYKNISISILERIGRILLHPAEERRIAQGHVERLRIRPHSVEPPLRTLSGGNQQKVALARWLTHLPRVLVLAEPTRGMDVGAKDDVVHIVKGLKEQGIAVLVASAEPETVLAMADRILVLRKGAVTSELADETVGKDRLLAAA